MDGNGRFLCKANPNQPSLLPGPCPDCATEWAKQAWQGWLETGYSEEFLLAILGVGCAKTAIQRIANGNVN